MGRGQGVWGFAGRGSAEVSKVTPDERLGDTVGSSFALSLPSLLHLWTHQPSLLPFVHHLPCLPVL